MSASMELCRLIEHFPDVLKDRDDVPDDQLGQYLNSTAEVLRMIEVRFRAVKIAMFTGMRRYSAVGRTMAFDTAEPGLTVTVNVAIAIDFWYESRPYFTMFPSVHTQAFAECARHADAFPEPQTLAPDSGRSQSCPVSDCLQSQRCTGQVLHRMLALFNFVDQILSTIFFQEKAPPGTLLVYHTTAQGAKLADDPKQHEHTPLGRHGHLVQLNAAGRQVSYALNPKSKPKQSYRTVTQRSYKDRGGLLCPIT